MKKLLLAAMALAILPFTGASAEPPERSYELVAGGSQTWDGPQSPAINANYHGNLDTGEPAIDDEVRKVSPVGVCSSDPTTYCDYTLVKVSNPVPETDTDGKLSRPIQFTVREALGDLDLRIYESNPEGEAVTFIGQSAGPLDTLDHTDLDETFGFNVITTRPTVAKPTQPLVSEKYYLVEVVYYAAAGYTGGVSF